MIVCENELWHEAFINPHFLSVSSVKSVVDRSPGAVPWSSPGGRAEFASDERFARHWWAAHIKRVPEGRTKRVAGDGC